MAKTTSKSKTNYFSVYKSTNRWKTNRERKLAKVLKNNPNCTSTQEALKTVLKYRRKKPSGQGGWSKTNIRIAMLFKQFTGRASHDLFSSNPKVQAAALAMHPKKPLKPVDGKVSFSLGARAHNQYGTRVWG